MSTTMPTASEEYWERRMERERNKRQEEWVFFAGQVLAGVGMGLLYAAGKVIEKYKEGK